MYVVHPNVTVPECCMAVAGSSLPNVCIAPLYM